MNNARNHIAPHLGQAPVGAGDGPSGEPLPADLQAIDWQALRSRLFAAHDMLGVLGSDARAAGLRLRGSFAGGTATALDAYRKSLGNINLDASGNGKPARLNDLSATGVSGNGERGQR